MNEYWMHQWEEHLIQVGKTLLLLIEFLQGLIFSIITWGETGFFYMKPTNK